jgi:type II secretory pathway pseudopilin PulG
MLLQKTRPDRDSSSAEDGYLLLTVLVMVFLMLLVLSIAAPRVAKEIQRDKEREAVQRGLQYRRAIQLYYKKFGNYPTDVKQLENTNEIRFLRKRYKDPITGKDDWRLIHMGEAKVPPMGFFGQPLQAGLSSASTGPGLGTASQGLYSPGTTGTGTTGDADGSANGAAPGSTNNSGGTSGGASTFGFSNSGSGTGIGNSGGTVGSTVGSTLGSSNSGFGGSTNPTGTNGPGASSMSGGSTFGSGGPIVGVGIPMKKDSMLEYHKQKKYSQWEFVYDPQQDMMMTAGATNGGNMNGSGNNPVGTGASGPNGGSGSGGSGSGSSGFGFGNSGSGTSGSGSSGFGNFGSGSGSGSGSGFGSSPPSTPPSTPPSSPQQ